MTPLRISLLALSMALVASDVASQPPSIQPGTMPRDSLDRWLARASNAGRWGADDQLGTLNLITPAARRRAAGLVREGRSISLAHELIPGPNPRAIGPLSLRLLTYPVDSFVTWSLDSTTVLFHGWAYSHIDALSHVAWRSKLYNGAAVDAAGKPGFGIETMGTGIVARAVLVDMPLLLGVPHLEPGTVITVADLVRWERFAGIRIDTGDVVLIRTGRWAREAAKGPWDVTRGAAGPHPAVALWLHSRGASALGGDVSNEFYPSLVSGVSDPLHMIALTAMGMPLMDNLDLEEIAKAAAAQRRWAFMFVAAPLRIRGGSGSLVNPLAIF